MSARNAGSSKTDIMVSRRRCAFCRLAFSLAARRITLCSVRNAPTLERRRRWIRALRQAGVRLLVVTGVYGPRLRRLLVERARVVVNVHFYANALLEVHRLMECASLGVPVVSEAGINPEERAEHAAVLRAVRFVPVGNVSAMCRALM